MEFEKRKAQALAAMAAPRPDKSPKGTVDAPIVPLLDAINRHPSFFTTSSCSGRISILAHRTNPPPSSADATAGNPKLEAAAPKKKKKAGGGGWLFVSHDSADPEAIVDLLFGDRRDSEGGDLVFRFEPLIVAVECRDLASAQSLVSTAISCGFRESGMTSIQKRIMVAIRCSIRLEVPLGQIGFIMISPEYVRYLVRIANDKMEANRKRTDGFLHVLQSKVLPGPGKEVIDSNKKGLEQIADKGFSLDFETKPNVVLSEISIENGTSKSHTEDNILGFIKDRCDSEPAGYSGEDKCAVASCKNSLKVSDPLHDKEIGYSHKEIADKDSNIELSGTPKCFLSVVMLKIVGEPIEKLFLWGQSACASNNGGQEHILVFGGFGGVGRHERRNCSLVLDPQSGLLSEINSTKPPSPRLGHTASMVGREIYVIGGRGGPSQILNDVWVLDTTENRWSLLECTGSAFNPRHRHAAAAVGSNIYVFGGLNNEVIYSCMNVLNTQTLQWSNVSIQGDWPCARHSHSLVASGPQLFMFGGYDGEKALGDLYSFDVRTLQWRKEETSGRAPSPRFSHSMFIYKNYLGIIGGCPVRQQYQELALLNMHHLVWMHVTIDSLGGDLWVRSSTCLIGEDLVIVGGGASCYAFGTKFNEPMKIDLHLLESLHNLPSDKENKSFLQFHDTHGNMNLQQDKHVDGMLDSSDVNLRIDISTNEDGHDVDGEHLVIKLEKKYAKPVKDILKKFGWLDLTRKVRPSQDGCHIYLPVSRNFYAFYVEEQFNSVNNFDNLEAFYQLGEFSLKELSVNEVSQSTALNFLLSCGGSLLDDDVVCMRKVHKSPEKMIKESVCSMLRIKRMPLQLLEQLPTRWEHLGDIVVLPKTSFKDPIWDSIGKELWPIVAKALGANRLARQGRILPTGTRDSTLEILVGDNGWVTHQENGILYTFDATKCMFSSGNLSEKLRMASLDCRDEIIVDLFAGIGYFVLPFLVKARAKLVYACEWNPHALKALEHNINANSVADRCVILEGDNCVTAPKGVAHRVCLGLLPSSECSWVTAVRALRAEGGMLHVHGNVNDSEEFSWSEYVVNSIRSIAQSEGLHWAVSVEHVERVKWYGPHIRHLVADVRCKQA
ncbi:tRNA wybutosine-synthesizing protein 2/3/4 isoform X2 [Phoenix dactylifera]|uniref:tRNA wybutosine-synthesizing protein 2/3/4 isoform X2 n=1 Tax=Phoenix dactylifera TaxID=42345 RepID=A0A8B9ADC0_PHODC|nr:tRNA wybutosine-synthesizing protein 2/3/4 isoform X2 [Phoenix dactylifera]